MSIEEFKSYYNVKSDVIALACWYEDNVFEPAKAGEDYIELYVKKYENDYIEGLFDNIVIDIKELVDNDWFNNYSILGVGNYGFDESIENGDYVEINKNETLILVRN